MTCRRVWLTSVTLAVCLAGLSSSYVSTAHIQQQTGFCFAHHDSRPARLHNQAVSYMGIPVPAVCMAAIMLLIVYEIRKHQKNRWSTFLQQSCSSSGSGGGDGTKIIGVPNDRLRNQYRNEARAEVAMTIMLLTATLVFILLSFPLFIYIVSPPEFDPRRPVDQALSFVWLEVAKGLEVFSHTLNFFIYFLSARKFRNRLLKVCGVPTNVVKSLRMSRRKRTAETSHFLITTDNNAERSNRRDNDNNNR